MRARPSLTVIILVVLLGLALPLRAQAKAVGQLTMVEGGVDLLKGGELPAHPVKVGEGVEPGDVLRTKSGSKAQITFLDHSTLTISPESRIAIEEYLFDGAGGKRNAVLQMFQGLALVAVSKILNVETTDFIVKTHTVVPGDPRHRGGYSLKPQFLCLFKFSGS